MMSVSPIRIEDENEISLIKDAKEKKDLEGKPKKKKREVKLSPEENIMRDKLSDYLKHEILYYEDNAPIPSFFWIRMLGMREGKFIIGRDETITVDSFYTFEDIYYATIYCKAELKKMLASKEWNGETHKLNAICLVVEKYLYTIKKRRMKLEETKIKAESEDLTKHLDNPKIEDRYVVKSKKVNPNLEEYW